MVECTVDGGSLNHTVSQEVKVTQFTWGDGKGDGKGEESKLLMARVKHFSTKRKTHHVETAEIIFNDQSKD